MSDYWIGFVSGAICIAFLSISLLAVVANHKLNNDIKELLGK